MGQLLEIRREVDQKLKDAESELKAATVSVCCVVDYHQKMIISFEKFFFFCPLPRFEELIVLKCVFYTLEIFDKVMMKDF